MVKESQNLIYLDHASTTYIRDEVYEVMKPYLTNNFGNPSSIYTIAQQSRVAIDQSREKVAKILNCRPSEIIFTSGGTESDNSSIYSTAIAQMNIGKHIITSSIEHHAVLNACEFLEENLNFKITYLPVNNQGIVNIESLKSQLTSKTTLVSIMLANNEIGTIQPINEISKIIKDYAKRNNTKILIHTDAVQAPGYINLDVKNLDVDLLSLSSHKFYGPKGCGILYVKRGTPFTPITVGGNQERQRRAGTENVSGIVGTAKALELAELERIEITNKTTLLRDKLISGVLKNIEKVTLNGDPINRIANNAHFSFQDVEGESILLSLDLEGIAASSGSACTSASLEPSHVLKSLGLTDETAQSSVRMTLGRNTTEEEINSVLDTLPKIVTRLRSMPTLSNVL
ncbi:MAG: cysteine desulfurase NifS [Rickettsiales bacterium]|nr:cysteine desulfurase NifS [Rickettsiales bacterium]MBS95832.1 cysteine desulfurase NifS [Chloroflexota bacterium]MQG50659.1 aminotransferase class V-fold PLP-dependent enzyme [SAR202 cluster bacterium]|tara:strand:+ start:1429 stop:2628 length:1200 start_codon:yes stop_codon:yes gene_type:complete